MSALKSGDLAIVLYCAYEPNNGRIIQVKDGFIGICGWLFWHYEGTLERDGDFTISDDCLRKIENPGDSVTDVRDILIPEHLREGVPA